MIVEDEPRINTNRHEYRWASIAATTSRNGAHPGLCFARTHGASADRVARCHIAGKLSGTLRQCMRAGRPRSRVRAGLPGGSPPDVAEPSRLAALGVAW